ncbi:hypothetical protein BWQ96_09787 [Gracilariopsis chorda]|uniref:Uncharacterized protein n=1 Tax=Gracilariopsis chorda TaxID=448386 RepID=A0A2V3IEJ0_9FLOR|nr:hypothetical protein BWQ96_09787 [Gracilariopsis chorda]|eukprot:PXF40506.1 hypothetical protein BWQ96_09787 [Gracilariopsis chorda]
MRGLFSGHRQSTPLGPPSSSRREAAREETLQAVRKRQLEKQRQFVMQMRRAEEQRNQARSDNDAEKTMEAETQRAQMSKAVDMLSQQIMVIERIMEECGLALDLEDEARAEREMLEQSREACEEGAAEADVALQEQSEQTAYINKLSASFMAPSDVLDEDEAMRDLDECAKQTGRA